MAYHHEQRARGRGRAFCRGRGDVIAYYKLQQANEQQAQANESRPTFTPSAVQYVDTVRGRASRGPRDVIAQYLQQAVADESRPTCTPSGPPEIIVPSASAVQCVDTVRGRGRASRGPRDVIAQYLQQAVADESRPTCTPSGPPEIIVHSASAVQCVDTVRGRGRASRGPKDVIAQYLQQAVADKSRPTCTPSGPPEIIVPSASAVQCVDTVRGRGRATRGPKDVIAQYLQQAVADESRPTCSPSGPPEIIVPSASAVQCVDTIRGRGRATRGPKDVIAQYLQQAVADESRPTCTLSGPPEIIVPCASAVQCVDTIRGRGRASRGPKDVIAQYLQQAVADESRPTCTPSGPPEIIVPSATAVQCVDTIRGRGRATRGPKDVIAQYLQQAVADESRPTCTPSGPPEIIVPSASAVQCVDTIRGRGRASRGPKDVISQYLQQAVADESRPTCTPSGSPEIIVSSASAVQCVDTVRGRGRGSASRGPRDVIAQYLQQAVADDPRPTCTPSGPPEIIVPSASAVQCVDTVRARGRGRHAQSSRNGDKSKGIADVPFGSEYAPPE